MGRSKMDKSPWKPTSFVLDESLDEETQRSSKEAIIGNFMVSALYDGASSEMEADIAKGAIGNFMKMRAAITDKQALDEYINTIYGFVILAKLNTRAAMKRNSSNGGKKGAETRANNSSWEDKAWEIVLKLYKEGKTFPTKAALVRRLEKEFGPSPPVGEKTLTSFAKKVEDLNIWPEMNRKRST